MKRTLVALVAVSLTLAAPANAETRSKVAPSVILPPEAVSETTVGGIEAWDLPGLDLYEAVREFEQRMPVNVPLGGKPRLSARTISWSRYTQHIRCRCDQLI
jgi:hypothetical protein